jgi:hypothetical protein
MKRLEEWLEVRGFVVEWEAEGKRVGGVFVGRSKQSLRGAVRTTWSIGVSLPGLETCESGWFAVR